MLVYSSYAHTPVLTHCYILHLIYAEMSPEFVLVLADLIFKTLFIYDDRGSRKAVDDVIVKALSEVTFMKSFAAALVQCMERQLKSQSHIGCYRLLKWSCLLLSKSQFATVSKNALCRVAAVQSSVLHIAMQGSFRERRACKKTFLHLFSEVPLLNTLSLCLKLNKSCFLILLFCILWLLLFSHQTFTKPTWSNWKTQGSHIKMVLNLYDLFWSFQFPFPLCLTNGR